MISPKDSKYSCVDRKPFFLLNAIFFLALMVLVLNDHYWKGTYSNALTGKLSDIAGLVLLPLYLAYLFPRLGQRAVWVSAVFFLFWKSPLATPFIDCYSLVAPISITRVIDYTDYLAFAILPLPWWMIGSPQKWMRLQFSAQRKTLGLIVLLVTSVSFVATSPPYWYRLSVRSGNVQFYKGPYKVRKSQSEILARLKADEIAFKYYYRTDTLLLATADFDIDSLANNPFNSFVIPQLIVEEDTFYDISFSLIAQSSKQTNVLLSSMNMPGLTATEIDTKMRRTYLKLLKQEIVKKARN